MSNINSNDEGTWRRIRVVDFRSKFTENPVYDDPDEPFQFEVDKRLQDKFHNWKITKNNSIAHGPSGCHKTTQTEKYQDITS